MRKTLQKYQEQKDATTTENPSKTKDTKTMMLKQFIQSQIDEDTNHQDQILVTGTPEKSTHITNRDATRIDITVKIVINLIPEATTRMMTDDMELLGTVDQPEEPAKKKRKAHPERTSYGNAQKVCSYATESDQKA